MRRKKETHKDKEKAVVVGILTHKGGVGKTFLAKHLIYLLGGLDNKVLGVDYDTQGDLMKWATEYAWDGEDFIEMENFDLLYSPENLNVVEEYLYDYDFIIIDGRPEYRGIGRVLSFLDVLIVPVEGRLSFEGTRDILEILSLISKEIDILVVRNKLSRLSVDLNRKEKKVIEALVNEYGVELHIVSIVYSEAVRMAEMQGKYAWEFPGHIGRGIAVSLGSIANWLNLNYGNGKVYKLAKKLEVENE